MNPGTAGLARGLAVLEALSGAERDGLGVVELTRRVGTDKSQLSRTLQTLERHGFVERDPATLAFRLGWRVFGLAAQVADRRLVRAAPPVLRTLVRDLGESAHLSVRADDAVLTLVSEAPPATIHAPAVVGRLTPLATTSSGRVLATALADDELDAYGLAEARDAIARVRAAGYAIVREEFEPGLVAVAAPVRDGAGAVVAAVNVSAPRFRFDDRLEPSVPAVVAAADALSDAIAGRRSV